MFSLFHKKTPVHSQDQNTTVVIRTMHDDLSRLANAPLSLKQLPTPPAPPSPPLPIAKKLTPPLQRSKIETLKTLPDTSKGLSQSPFFASKQQIPLHTPLPAAKKIILKPLPKEIPPTLKKESVSNAPRIPDQKTAPPPFQTPKTKPPLTPAPASTRLKPFQTPQLTQNQSPVKPISLPHFNQLGSTSFSNLPSDSSPLSADMPLSNITFEKSSRHGVMIFIVVLSIIVAVSLGGYYFWITRNPTLPNLLPKPSTDSLPATPLANSPFSLTSANYLPINVETASVENLQALFQKTREEIRGAAIKEPVEFFITDQNNNPISLSIFSALYGLKLPPALFESLDDQFSFFLYQDGAEARVALVLGMQNASNAGTFLAKNEKILVNGLTPLYSGTALTPTTSGFNSSLYDDHPIRYQNLHPDGTLSLDYTFTPKQLIFATSKNTLRAVLDYLAQH